MYNFLTGVIVMYALGIPLISTFVESEDLENDPNADMRFTLMWPYVAVATIITMLIHGMDDDDGTGTT